MKIYYMKQICQLLCLISVSRITTYSSFKFVEVNTHIGGIKGFRNSVNINLSQDCGNSGRPMEINTFLGIPYAMPPINKLRFQAPMPNTPLPQHYVYEALKFSNMCSQAVNNKSQGHLKIDEDCLYLNIWTPTNLSLLEKDKELLPVNYNKINSYLALKKILIYIHGGGFTRGTASTTKFDGTFLAAYGNAVIVTINYRLGAFGFLYTDSNNANPGNMGLLDQRLAIHWVQTNAKVFGGDPYLITLFGQSAGASSVYYHLMTPYPFLPWDINIRRVILQSGSLSLPWSSSTKITAFLRAVKLAENLGCNIYNQFYDLIPNDYPNDKSWEIISQYDYRDLELRFKPQIAEIILNCLKQKSMNEIIEATANITNNWVDFPFLPILSDTILPLYARLPTSKHRLTEAIIGSTLNESLVFTQNKFKTLHSALLPNDDDDELTIKLMTDFELNQFVKKVYYKYSDYGQDLIKLFYSGCSSIQNKSKNFKLNLINDLTNDYWFQCGINDVINMFINQNINVYSYLFGHRSSQNTAPLWTGVRHEEELEFLFGLPLLNGSSYTDKEKELSVKLMMIWTNFAKIGNPNLEGDSWQRINIDNSAILIDDNKFLNSTPSKIQDYRVNACRFQNLIYQWNKRFFNLLIK